jgi:AraC-like DNA-binding protein
MALSSDKCNLLKLSMKKSLLVFLMIIYFTHVYSAKSGYNISRPYYWDKYSTQTLINKAKTFVKNNQPDSTLFYYTLVANRYYEGWKDNNELDMIIMAMHNTGCLYEYYYYDFEKAYTNLQLSLSVSEKYGLKKMLPYSYFNIASIYQTNGEIHQSKDYDDLVMHYLIKGFYSACDVKDWKILNSIFGALCNISIQSDNVSLITNEIKEYKKIYKYQENIVSSFHLFYDMVTCYNKKDYDGALLAVNKILKSSDVNMENKVVINAYFDKIHILLKMKRDKEAMACLKETEKVAKTYNTKDILVYAYRMLYLFYKERKETSLAHKYQFLYLLKKDSLLNNNKLGSIDKMRFMNNINTMNDQVKNISHERQIQRILLILASFIILLIVVFLCLLIRNYKQLKRDHKRLYYNNVEILAKEKKEREMREKLQEQIEYYKSNQTQAKSYKSNKQDVMPSDDNDCLYESIKKVMENTKEICVVDFTLNRLAELVNSKNWHVSKVINEKYGSNFNSFLNEYRIKEACRRLNDTDKYGKFTIEAISESVGFKSRSNFVAIFKGIVGITPSAYQKIANGAL